MSTVLDPEQEQVLEFLVEAYRRSSDRQPFYAAQPANSHNLHLAHAGVPRDHPGIYPADIQTLSEAGLLRLERPDHSTWRFDLTPAAFRYYATMIERRGGGTRTVEETTHSYFDSVKFVSRHPTPFAKWRQAEQLLWSGDGQQQLTTIGHLCREAMQLFATSLLSHRPSADAPLDPVKTVARVRRALDSVPNYAKKALCEAMVAYWGEVADFAQRQEHGAQKEGQALEWEDGRMLVFHTLFTMVELDRISK